MKTFLTLLILLILKVPSFGQNLYLETFDSKESIKKWKIKTNGQMSYSNNFTYLGQTFSKPSKDSFLIFYDNAFNVDYSFSISRKFKAIPCQDISFKLSLLSNDTLGMDKILCTWRIFDRNKKTLFSIVLPKYQYSKGNIGVGSVGLTMSETKDDSLWINADSMEIVISYSPQHPFNNFDRMVVIDEVYLNRVFASMEDRPKIDFQIFPNPATKILNFKFSPFLKPLTINIYDFTVRLILTTPKVDELNIENLNPGLYFTTIRFENGATATKKVQVF